MSRTYKVMRRGYEFRGARKVWVVSNRGHKVFQRRLNKRSRHLGKVAIAEAISEMIKNKYEAMVELMEHFDDRHDDSFFDDEYNEMFDDTVLEEELEVDYGSRDYWYNEGWDDYDLGLFR